MRNCRAFFCALGFAFVLGACGDLGMVLPSQGSYQVNAQVDGDYTLDAYSVVSKTSRIRPYFVNSVVNDPDVRGITVFMQAYSGAIVSRKVQYLLSSGDARKKADEPESPAKTPSETPGTTTPAAEGALDRPPEDKTVTSGETKASAGPETDPQAGEPEFSGEVQPEPSAPVFDDPAAETAGDYPAETPADISGKTGGGDTRIAAGAKNKDPEAGAPAGDPADATGSAAGTDAADRAAAGKDAADTVSAGADGTGAVNADAVKTDNTDTVEDDVDGTDAIDAGIANTDAADRDTAVPAPLPVDPPAPARTPSIPEDETILVRELDQYLPAFRIVEELDIGRYNLVFQVMGEKEILYRTFKPVYFIGDAVFTQGDIQIFLPAAVTGGRLIPPGINVMLETKTSADPRLDPYVIWHNGKNILAQGRLSAGANSLLWKTPEQTGFHNIRAEVFPLLPDDRMPGNMIGKIKELSLPVSLKSEGVQRFNDSSGEFISWYQLWGTLNDAKAPNSPDRSLAPLYGQTPRWIPFGGIYGLLVGQDDIYTLPGAPFTVSADEEGTGRILLHLAALSEGAIINISFADGETPRERTDSSRAELDLSFAGDALFLRIASDDTFREELLELNGDEAKGFITLVVEFTLAPDHLDAELRLENPAGTTGLLSVPLAAPASGGGAVRLGGAASAPRRSVQRTASDEAGKYNGTVALNELALSYTRRSVPQKEEDPESGIPETLLAEKNNPGAEPESPSPNAL